MSNMLDFVKSEMRSFQELPFCEIDSVILTWISYLQLPEAFEDARTIPGRSIREIFMAEHFPYMMRTVKSPKETYEMLAALIASPRYRQICLFNYRDSLDPELDKQFAAVSYWIQPNLVYVAYRGTDSSFTGWKEDFNLALENPIPSQLEACVYLNELGRMVPGVEFLVGGHSKGGNLAVFAAAKCEHEIQDRILQIYSHDGPGFRREVLEDPMFRVIEPKIRKTLPQSSLIGMIMEQECEYEIVKSDTFSVAQHNPFSWQVDAGELVRVEKLTPDARLLYKTLNQWLAQLNYQERELFVNTVFDILEGTGTAGFDELGAELVQEIPSIMKKVAKLDKETRHFMFRTFGHLASLGVKNVPRMIAESRKNEDRTEEPGVCEIEDGADLSLLMDSSVYQGN